MVGCSPPCDDCATAPRAGCTRPRPAPGGVKSPASWKLYHDYRHNTLHETSSNLRSVVHHSSQEVRLVDNHSSPHEQQMSSTIVPPPSSHATRTHTVPLIQRHTPHRTRTRTHRLIIYLSSTYLFMIIPTSSCPRRGVPSFEHVTT